MKTCYNFCYKLGVKFLYKTSVFFCCIRPLYSTTRQKRFFFNAARSLVTEERKPSVITRIECTYGTEILLSIVFMNVFLFIQYQVFDKLDFSDLLIFDLLTKNWSTVSSYGNNSYVDKLRHVCVRRLFILKC